MIKKEHAAILVGAMLLTGAHLAQAQVTIGPRVGVNLANVSYDVEDADFDVDPKTLLAPQVGITANLSFGHLALQPSLLFSQKGFKIDEELSETDQGVTYTLKATGSSRMNYLEVPVNFVYSTGEDEGFQIFAGPYLGIGLGGKVKSDITISGGGDSFTESESTNIKFASKDDENSDDQIVRQPDFGANFGVGYKAGPFQVQAGYSLGLSNLVPDSADGEEPEDKVQHRVVQVSLSYFFGNK